MWWLAEICIFIVNLSNWVCLNRLWFGQVKLAGIAAPHLLVRSKPFLP